MLQDRPTRSQIVDIVRQVRRRWRLRIALRGALGVLGLGVLALLGAAWTLEALRFTPGSIFAFRILIALVFLGLTAFVLLRPLARRVTDEQVALYLEEHEPSLAGALGVVAMASLAVFTFGPAYLRHALSALLIVSRSVQAAAPYKIDVTPGSVTVSRGADLSISARLQGFEADQGRRSKPCRSCAATGRSTTG
jgi:hypothetical protein